MLLCSDWSVENTESYYNASGDDDDDDDGAGDTDADDDHDDYGDDDNDDDDDAADDGIGMSSDLIGIGMSSVAYRYRIVISKIGKLNTNVYAFDV